MRIRPEIFDFGSDLGLKLGQAKPEISGKVPANWHTTIPHDFWPISKCFDRDPKLIMCEITQPRIWLPFAGGFSIADNWADLREPDTYILYLYFIFMYFFGRHPESQFVHEGA